MRIDNDTRGVSKGMSLLLHAPNVHDGGGMVLLREVLSLSDTPIAWAQLDRRIKDVERIPHAVDARYVRPTLRSRLYAEWRLWRKTQSSDIVLCFHGLPPLFSLRGRTIVFQQNCLLSGYQSLAGFPKEVAMRISVERVWCRMFRHHVDRYVVQTPSMAANLRDWHRREPQVQVLPFGKFPMDTETVSASTDEYDFIYVASGDAHKNHECLIEAWVLLAQAGIYPTLALTLGSKNRRLLSLLETHRSESQIRIDNLGKLPRKQVLGLYKRVRALIFPSTDESFGLPLLEAEACGLPIVAAERDYVRDVATPVETFDPESPVSIARAVRRFLGCPEAPISVISASEFVEKIRHP